MESLALYKYGKTNTCIYYHMYWYIVKNILILTMELYFNTYTCMNLDDATYMYYHDQTSINEEKKDHLLFNSTGHI